LVFRLFQDLRKRLPAQAYLEFFCSPAAFQDLVGQLSADPNVTYYAVTKQGDLHTNTTSDEPNAVTWGVFPGKEVVQSTIVERISFMAWKVGTPRCERAV
jgi:methylenetetrahydrofolate reductase (NADPH)